MSRRGKRRAAPGAAPASQDPQAPEPSAPAPTTPVLSSVPESDDRRVLHAEEAYGSDSEIDECVGQDSDGEVEEPAPDLTEADIGVEEPLDASTAPPALESVPSDGEGAAGPAQPAVLTTDQIMTLKVSELKSYIDMRGGSTKIRDDSTGKERVRKKPELQEELKRVAGAAIRDIPAAAAGSVAAAAGLKHLDASAEWKVLEASGEAEEPVRPDHLYGPTAEENVALGKKLEFDETFDRPRFSGPNQDTILKAEWLAQHKLDTSGSHRLTRANNFRILTQSGRGRTCSCVKDAACVFASLVGNRGTLANKNLHLHPPPCVDTVLFVVFLCFSKSPPWSSLPRTLCCRRNRLKLASIMYQILCYEL